MQIQIREIRESRTNPRRTWGDLDALAASLRSEGQLEPICVRQIDDGQTRFEIVFGARRYRAAIRAGFDHIDAIVREMSDEQVRTAQLVENIQREGLTLLEQADAIAALLETLDAEDVAARTGLAVDRVRELYLVAGLVRPLRQMIEAGRILDASALALARCEADVQAEIAARLEVEHEIESGPISRRQVEAEIDACSRELRRAPFDVADGALLTTAPACDRCPHNTATQGDLFEAPEGRCLRGACWQEKADAAWTRVEADAKKRGLRVLTPEELDAERDPKRAAWVFLRDEAVDGATWDDVFDDLSGEEQHLAIARVTDGSRGFTLVTRARAAERIEERGHPEVARRLLRQPDPAVAEEREKKKTAKQQAEADRAREIAMLRFALGEYRRVQQLPDDDRAEALQRRRLRLLIASVVGHVGEGACALACDVLAAERTDATGEPVKATEAVLRFAAEERPLGQLEDALDLLLWCGDREDSESRVSAWTLWREELSIHRNDPRWNEGAEKPKRKRRKKASAEQTEIATGEEVGDAAEE